MAYKQRKKTETEGYNGMAVTSSYEWGDYRNLIEREYFIISSNLFQYQETIHTITGIQLFGAEHITRRLEYPWAYLQAQKGKHCLDAGSGLSPFPFSLKEIYETVTILEIDTNAINQLNTIIDTCGYQTIKAQYGDIRKIPYPDNYFDDVFCLSVLEHGPVNPFLIETVDELLRVTKQNLYITMDVGPQGTPSGPLSYQQLEELANHLTMPLQPEPKQILRFQDTKLEYMVACITIKKRS